MAGLIQPAAVVVLFGIAYGFKFFSAKFPNGLRG
ncbi:hypothetical protein NS506_03114 [Nocardia seriolae]|uniref:Uncharacterized protein n=1 Tax=Nocardia seriolae TaxID=37332 RepID=A0ABC8ASA3_9NOCA|nr:hypothetical protein NS506_03114 [Nocardia seriolae]